VLAAAGGDDERLKPGDRLPDLGAYRLEGDLPALPPKGALLLDFWASWCAPCKQSFPALQRLHEAYAARGLVILAVSVDDDDAAMRQFLEQQTATFHVARDAGHALVESCAIAAMPTSFLVDGDGRVRYVHNGFHEGETEPELRRQIEELLP
jgi:thiol-disulfide isomerase/thioredoxin